MWVSYLSASLNPCGDFCFLSFVISVIWLLREAFTLVPSLGAFQELRHTLKQFAEIDIWVMGRRTEERGDKEMR